TRRRAQVRREDNVVRSYRLIRNHRTRGFSRVSIFFEHHGQMAVAVNKTGVHALGLADDVYPQPAPLHFRNQCGELKLGDTRSDAAMDAVTEGEVAACIFAVNDDA